MEYYILQLILLLIIFVRVITILSVSPIFNSEVIPKKLMTLAQIYDENYYYLLYLAGYIDENPQDISVSNEMLLQKSIDIDKLLSDPKIKVHFSGNPIDDDKKKAIISILNILTKKV